MVRAAPSGLTVAHRQRGIALASALALFASLAGCTPSAGIRPDQGRAQAGERCSDGTTTIDRSFAGGAFAKCEVLGAGHFRLTIAPEDGKVINCSAWYAFQATTAQPRQLTVDLHYATCGHRYRPKVRWGNEDWRPLEPQAVSANFARGRTSADGKPLPDASIKLTIRSGKTLVAGQELLLPAEYSAWLDQMARSPAVKRSTLGHSREGRAIERLDIHEPGPVTERQVVLTGRQHPPEITGALALQAFVARLLENDQLARTYRTRFTTIVVPLLNPDGVVHGHWRHNMGQTDLNRDWGIFSQPETVLMRDLLQGIESDPNRRLRLFLDFHSTFHDTVYTLPDSLVTDPADFTRQWLAAYQALIPDHALRVDPGHNPGLATSKTWVYQRYRVPTATYEIGDETDRDQIRDHARAAAEAMMATLLKIDA